MRLPQMKIWILMVLAFIIGLVAGWIDFRISELLPTAITLVAFNLLFGYLQPRLAWLWAVLSGIGPFLVYLFAGVLMGFEPSSWPQPNVAFSLMAIIPAFIGAYWGVVINWIFSQAKKA